MLSFDVSRVGDVSTAIATIVSAFNFEAIQTARSIFQSGGNQVTVGVDLEISNPDAKNTQAFTQTCQIVIEDVPEPPAWNKPIALTQRSSFFVVEECAGEVGKFTKQYVALDPDFTTSDIAYSTDS